MPGWQNEPAHGATGGWLWVCLSRSVSLSVTFSLCLSISPSVYPSVIICLSIYPSIYLSFYLSISLSISLSLYLSLYLSIYLCICLSVYLSTSICLSLYLSIHPQRRALFRYRNVQKWNEHAVFLDVLSMLTSKCASRRNAVHFFNIPPSKSVPNVVLCKCWLPNVLRATTACTF